MTEPEPPADDDRLLPGSITAVIRRAIRARRRIPVLRKGLRDVVRGAREGDRLLQLMGWSLVAAGIYQRWKRSQEPSRLYATYLDMDEAIGIRVLQKGKVVGEFPVGGSGG